MPSLTSAPPARLPDELLRAWLAEDVPHGDLSTESLAIGQCHARMHFSARAAMCASGIEEAARLIDLCGGRAQALWASGQPAPSGQALLQARGPAAALLRAWKVAQTLVETMSGIASGVRQIVDGLADAGCPVPVACTRKTVPGARALSARAVRDGGGVMHRLGLSETLLVFPEHRALMAPGDWPQALARLAAAQPEKRVVVEVGSVADALAAARAGAEVVQLERFSPEQLAVLRATLQAQGLRVRLAPAGGVTAANAVAYARAGADLLVTSAPYLAPPRDVQVRIEPDA
jgi:molybdenum transport protein